MGLTAIPSTTAPIAPAPPGKPGQPGQPRNTTLVNQNRGKKALPDYCPSKVQTICPNTNGKEIAMHAVGSKTFNFQDIKMQSYISMYVVISSHKIHVI